MRRSGLGVLEFAAGIARRRTALHRRVVGVREVQDARARRCPATSAARVARPGASRIPRSSVRGGAGARGGRPVRTRGAVSATAARSSARRRRRRRAGGLLGRGRATARSPRAPTPRSTACGGAGHVARVRGAPPRPLFIAVSRVYGRWYSAPWPPAAWRAPRREITGTNAASARPLLSGAMASAARHVSMYGSARRGRRDVSPNGGPPCNRHHRPRRRHLCPLDPVRRLPAPRPQGLRPLRGGCGRARSASGRFINGLPRRRASPDLWANGLPPSASPTASLLARRRQASPSSAPADGVAITSIAFRSRALRRRLQCCGAKTSRASRASPAPSWRPCGVRRRTAEVVARAASLDVKRVDGEADLRRRRGGCVRAFSRELAGFNGDLRWRSTPSPQKSSRRE